MIPFVFYNAALGRQFGDGDGKNYPTLLVKSSYWA